MILGSFKIVIDKMGLEIIYLIYMCKIIYNGWYAIKPNQTKLMESWSILSILDF